MEEKVIMRKKDKAMQKVNQLIQQKIKTTADSAD